MEVVARRGDTAVRYAGRSPMIVVGLDEHHRHTAIEGAFPGRILSVRNVVTPSGSGSRSGKSTVRKTQLPG